MTAQSLLGVYVESNREQIWSPSAIMPPPPPPRRINVERLSQRQAATQLTMKSPLPLRGK
eukprot:scaffold3998_cov153-Skeletonema_dohrnii-CCMP3373.AAC.18